MVRSASLFSLLACCGALQAGPREPRSTVVRRGAPADGGERPGGDERLDARWVTSLGLSGAAFGPLLDNFHGLAAVLTYDAMTVRAGCSDAAEQACLIQTAEWVPPLFAVAAWIIGGIVAGLDGDTARRPAAPRVATVVALFAAIYAASAALAYAGTLPATMSLLLWPLGVALWAFGDGTPAAFVAAAATAVGGPLIEISLTGGGGLCGAASS